MSHDPVAVNRAETSNVRRLDWEYSLGGIDDYQLAGEKHKRCKTAGLAY